jgi:hypothetical protein
MRALFTRFSAMVVSVLFVCISISFAVQVHPNMSDSRPAEVVIKSKLDIKAIDEIGGIIDNYKGNTVIAYLLPQDFRELQMRGMNVRWLTEAEIDPEGTRRLPHSALDDYTFYDDLEPMFVAWQTEYPDLFSFESIGQSVEGREIWACKLSDTVTVDQPEIEVKYVANMHGDEVVGFENCLRLIDTLLTGYGVDPEITELMSDFEIYMVPLMNPDGREAIPPTRYNSNGVDLNRTFPDRCDDSTNTTAGREPEIAAVMNWSAGRNFVLSANFHGGALVANYPWDNNYTHSSVYSPSPEQDLFFHLAYVYTSFNSTMFNSNEFPPDGTTNGADWYWVSGGMQDWNYVWMGDKEITFELGNNKAGPMSALESLWQQNRISLRKYLLEAQEGVRGFVTDAVSGDPVRANIMLGTISYVTYSSALHGEYYRILRPGSYSLTFSAPGYQSQTINSIAVVGGTPTVLNVQLNRTPAPEIAASPESINEPIDICSELDIPMTIHNSGTASLSWSGQEADDATWQNKTLLDSRTGGLAYNWRDISVSGTLVSFTSDDQNLGPYPIGFTFPFYGQSFTTYRISANGWISFTSSENQEPSWTNSALPNTARPENMIAAWWDDLSPQRTGTSIRRYTSGDDSLFISFEHVQSYQDNGLYNFQFILTSAGEILFQYADMGTNRLTSATIGMQNSDRTQGMTIAFNQTFIENNMALKICDGNVIELSPASGVIAASGSQIITAHLNSCCLPEGIYETSLQFSSNDPFNPLLVIPVTMDVGERIEPEAVADLRVAPEGEGVRLNWSAAANAEAYEVWRGSTPDFNTGTGSHLTDVTETTYLDNAAANEIGFYFVISKR